MRYLLLSAAILTILSGRCAAGDITWGAKAGLAAYSISQTPESWDDDEEFRFGPAAGAFLEYDFGNGLSIQPSLLYVQKGVGGNLYDGFVTVDLEMTVEYIEIPVLMAWTFRRDDDFRPRIMAGPSIGYNIASELEVSAFLLSADIDFSSVTGTTDFALIAGGGAEFLLGGRTFTFDALFQYGLTNVLVSGDFEINGSTQTIAEDDFKNYGFQLLAGYAF